MGNFETSSFVKETKDFLSLFSNPEFDFQVHSDFLMLKLKISS